LPTLAIPDTVNLQLRFSKQRHIIDAILELQVWGGDHGDRLLQVVWGQDG
jgi:hypothetical protein